jgi:SAM-dependent methyltransferase
MKLSELVALRNNLNNQPIVDIEFSTAQELSKLTSIIPDNSLISNNFSSKLTENINDINQSISKLGQTLDQLKTFVQQQISEQERHWFQESYRLYEVTMALETNKEILNRRLSIAGENTKHASFHSESMLRGKLSSYADWRFPALVIRPGLENFINEMVAYDPLYIIDQNSELLKPCLNSFPKQYQNRLRPYLLDDRASGLILEKIPNDQFGMCLIYNYLNYRPLEVIKRYLVEIFEKLRPGGICLITINDCDLPQAVELVEKNYACYTPGTLVQELIKSLGFNINSTWGDGGPSVWIELRKPGILDSMRGSQVISSIKHLEEINNDVDFLEFRPYTKEEIKMLHRKLKSFNIKKDAIKGLKPKEISDLVVKLDEQLAAESKKKREEEIRLHEEAERKRMEELHEEARTHGVDPTNLNELDIRQQIYEKINAVKKQELVLLRQRAMELRAGDPNLIRYGYSAEKLKQLIKAKEEGQ